MKISEATIQQLKNNIDCRDLIQRLGIYFNNSNISCSNINTSHKDKNPSMAVYQNHVLCFGCGFNADAIKIVQNIKSLNFNDSIEYLCNMYNISLTYENNNLLTNKKSKNTSDVIEKLWELIKNQPISSDYQIYMKKRKISYEIAYKEGCRDIFSIRSKINSFLSTYDNTTLEEAGLITFKDGRKKIWYPLSQIIRGNESYKGFIIPIFNMENNVTNFRYRLYNNIKIENKDKSDRIIKVFAQNKNSNFTSVIGLNKLNPTKDKSIYLCEGEPDYLSLKTFFNKNFIEDDVLGFCIISKDWNDSYSEILKKYKDVKICLHNTDKVKHLCSIIQTATIKSCSNLNEINYWKSNFYESLFNEKCDINDLLSKDNLSLSSFNFKNLIYKNPIELNNKLTNSNFLNIEPLNIIKAATSEPPKLEFVIPGLLRGIVGSVVAAGGTGKTMFALQICAHIACGKDLMGIGKVEAGKAVLISGEDPEEITTLRVNKLCNYISEDEISLLNENMFIYSVAGKNPNINEKKWYDWIKEITINSRLLVIDTLRVFHNLEENDSGKMSELIKTIGTIAVENKCSILFLHHTNKNSNINNAAETQQASRGSSVLTDNIKLQINLINMNDKEAKEFEIDEINKKMHVKLVYSKMNYGSPINDKWLKRDENGILKEANLFKQKNTEKKLSIIGGKHNGI